MRYFCNFGVPVYVWFACIVMSICSSLSVTFITTFELKTNFTVGNLFFIAFCISRNISSVVWIAFMFRLEIVCVKDERSVSIDVYAIVCTW